MYVVFVVEKGDFVGIERILKDDLVSRQSITTRDASVLGEMGEVRYVLIEGTKDGIKTARELFKSKKVGKALPAKKAKEVREKIKEQEESAAQGMGLIFGG